MSGTDTVKHMIGLIVVILCFFRVPLSLSSLAAELTEAVMQTIMMLGVLAALKPCCADSVVPTTSEPATLVPFAFTYCSTCTQYTST